jgi:hypothetical protein
MSMSAEIPNLSCMNLKELRQYIKDHGLNAKGRSKADILNKLKPELETRKNLKPLGQSAPEVPKTVSAPVSVQVSALPADSTNDAADSIYETLYANQLCMFGKFKHLTFEQVVRRFPETSAHICRMQPFMVSPFMIDRVIMFQKYARHMLKACSISDATQRAHI